MGRNIFILVLASLAMAARSASGAKLTPAQEKESARLYILKCAKCHELYPPQKYTSEEWTGWLAKMTRKSKLKGEAAENMKAYTAELRERKLEASGK